MSSLCPDIPETLSNRDQQGSVGPLGDSQLLWPSILNGNPPRCHDLPHFPEMYLVELRHQLGDINSDPETRLDLVLNTFISAVEHSLECILVLDPHFDDVGVNALAPALASSQAKDIRLLTAGGQEERDSMKPILQDFRNLNPHQNGTTQIFWRIGLDKYSYPFLHDRFAVVDSALWHFGSTVGGGHRGLTAASGPWSATETLGQEFFEDCWRRVNA